jgi:co-chaperonin GroES (HSP10)
MPLREGELALYLPDSEPVSFDLALASEAVRPLPGRLAVAPDLPRFSSGGILLSDVAAIKERPDAGTVVAVGGPRRLQSGEWSDPIPLHPGERVLLRPCKGKWLRDFQTSSGFSLPEIRFYGVTYPWSHEVLAVWRGEAWQPLSDWLIIRRESNESSSGVLIANPASQPKRHRAMVVNSQPGLGVLPGQEVLVDDHPNVGLAFCYGDLAGCEMVKMVDEDGYRQVWARLLD